METGSGNEVVGGEGMKPIPSTSYRTPSFIDKLSSSISTTPKLVDMEQGGDEDEEETEQRNITRLGKQLWLVRIPPDISARWEALEDNSTVGKITLTKTDNTEEVGLTLNGELVSPDLAATAPFPLNSKGSLFDEYKLTQIPVTSGTNNGIFAAWINSSESDISVMVAGSVQNKYKAFPVRSDKYTKHLKVKRKLQKLTQEPVQLNAPVNCFKPISDHKNNVDYKKKKKLEGRKSRGERDEVAQILFKAFESHQFYTFKDLVKITNQPASFLKELLSEYCNYSTKGVHRSYWELKPEYRHYGDWESGSQDSKTPQ